MGRRRPSYYYQRAADRAEQRENFLRTYQGPPPQTTVNSRGPKQDVFYTSLHLVEGTDHLTFSTKALTSTLGQVSAAEAGLLTVLPGGTVAQRLRGSGVKPTRAHWFRGDATPQYVSSRWGTRYPRTYTPGSHASLPFSRSGGAFDGDELRDAFVVLFGPSGTKRGLLGTTNGRAYLTMEEVNLNFGT